MKRKKKNKSQLELFDGTPSKHLREKIEMLDKEMRKAIDAQDFDKAKRLSEEQERLLSALMQSE